jgi:hypothetical protein
MKLSIITATRNCAATVADCMTSIIRQIIPTSNRSSSTAPPPMPLWRTSTGFRSPAASATTLVDNTAKLLYNFAA